MSNEQDKKIKLSCLIMSQWLWDLEHTTHSGQYLWEYEENSIWNTAVPVLSYSCMFHVEICSQQLESANLCACLSSAIIVETD